MRTRSAVTAVGAVVIVAAAAMTAPMNSIWTLGRAGAAAVVSTTRAALATSVSEVSSSCSQFWERTSAVSIPTDSGRHGLNGVSAMSNQNVWSVGYQVVATNVTQPLSAPSGSASPRSRC